MKTAIFYHFCFGKGSVIISLNFEAGPQTFPAIGITEYCNVMVLSL